MIHEYTEFGIKTKILKIKPVGGELKGMRSGKPFVQDGRIHINLNGKLNLVEGIEFFEEDGNPLSRLQVKLDTTTRIGIVLVTEGEVLLMKRIKPDRQFFAFPGGHVREGETNVEGLIRETQEELGLDIRKQKYHLISSLHEEGFGPERFYRVEFDKKPEVIPEDPDDDTTKLEWMKLEEAIRLENIFPKSVINLIL